MRILTSWDPLFFLILIGQVGCLQQAWAVSTNTDVDAGASPATRISEASFASRIVAKNSGLCLDISAYSRAVGLQVRQWACNGGLNQSFNFVPSSNGTYKIQPKNDDLCLDIASSGGGIIQNTCNGSSTQQFTVTAAGNGEYILETRSSGCLNVSENSKSNGGSIINYPCTGGDNELFSISGFVPAKLQAFSSSIVNQNSSMCFDISAYSSAIGLGLEQWRCTGGTNQAFQFEPNESGNYSIKPENNGLCLDLADGWQVVQNNCNGSRSQRFSVQSSVSGGYTILTSQGDCLNVSENSTAEGGKIISYPCTGASNEIFKLSGYGDVLGDYMTTPNFPVTDQPPTDPASKGPGDGLTLTSGYTPVMNMYFPGGPHAANIPDEKTLREYVYMNYLEGNLNAVIGSPMDTGQSNNNAFAAVARHYPLGSPHSTTPVMSDGLHMRAFCSNNYTNCSPGAVYGGFIRLTPPIRPGMTVKVRYKAPSGQHAWVPIWLFSGEQRTPGPGGNPYANHSSLIDFGASHHLFEIDMNDNYTRSDNGGAPFGSQIDYGTPNIYGNSWPAGKSPRFTYWANDGVSYVSHPKAGPPYLGLPDLDWSSTFHDLVLNWRNDGTNLIDVLLDGKVVVQSYLDYADLHTNDSAGNPLGEALMIGNQAIPSFSPGASKAIDNDGIETPGAEGWTEVIQEISIWNGNIQNVDSLKATP